MAIHGSVECSIQASVPLRCCPQAHWLGGERGEVRVRKSRRFCEWRQRSRIANDWQKDPLKLCHFACSPMQPSILSILDSPVESVCHARLFQFDLIEDRGVVDVLQQISGSAGPAPDVALSHLRRLPWITHPARGHPSSRFDSRRRPGVPASVAFPSTTRSSGPSRLRHTRDLAPIFRASHAWKPQACSPLAASPTQVQSSPAPLPEPLPTDESMTSMLLRSALHTHRLIDTVSLGWFSISQAEASGSVLGHQRGKCSGSGGAG